MAFLRSGPMYILGATCLLLSGCTDPYIDFHRVPPRTEAPITPTQATTDIQLLTNSHKTLKDFGTTTLQNQTNGTQQHAH